MLRKCLLYSVAILLVVTAGSPLLANGTPVWYLAAKDEGHGFAKKKNQDFQFYTTVLFMQRYLLGQ